MQVCTYMQHMLDETEGAGKANGGSAAAVSRGGMASAMMHPAVLDLVRACNGPTHTFHTHTLTYTH